MIRPVNPEDAKAIASIYNHFIENTTISFEENPVTAAAIKQRIAGVLNANLPWLVHESDGVLNGYAYATQWKDRSAYRFTAESTVYVANDAAKTGIGSALYQELINQLREQSFRSVIAVIALPNEGSIRLHEKFGFVKSGEFKEIGYKFDRWINVASWQLIIGD